MSINFTRLLECGPGWTFQFNRIDASGHALPRVVMRAWKGPAEGPALLEKSAAIVDDTVFAIDEAIRNASLLLVEACERNPILEEDPLA